MMRVTAETMRGIAPMISGICWAVGLVCTSLQCGYAQERAGNCNVGADGFNERVWICGASGVDDDENAGSRNGEAHERDKKRVQHIRHGNLL